MRRNHAHADEHVVRDQGTEGLSLFSQPAPESWQTRWASLSDEERRQQRERWKQLLLPIVLELAARRGGEGITASEVQTEGMLRGVLWGERSFLTANPRVYSFIGAWLSQLANDGALVPKVYRIEGGGSVKARRESERDPSHGNSAFVYLHPREAA